MALNSTIIPDNYNDIVYRTLYPVLWKLVPHIPRSITPNQLTVCAFLCTLVAAFLLVAVASPVAYLYWIVFNALWFILDALDGMHARNTGQSSEYGAFLDHALDNISFIFTFTAFVATFDLMHVFYIFILLLRFTAAIMVFTVQCHTKTLHLNTISGGMETVLMTVVMLLSFLFPHLNLAEHTSNSTLLWLIHTLSLESGVFMKIILWIYLAAIPIVFYTQFKFVRRESERPSDSLAE